MELAYEGIVKYMTEYFEAFNAYGQNPDTLPRMDKYVAPDMVVDERRMVVAAMIKAEILDSKT